MRRADSGGGGGLRGYPTTLDQLRDRLGTYGEAAVAEARWSAIIGWLMKLPAGAEEAGTITNPYRVCSTAVNLMRDHDRAVLGYPHHTRDNFASPLPQLSEASVTEARQVADETVADWQRADGPGLPRDRIGAIYQYVLVCTAGSAR